MDEVTQRNAALVEQAAAAVVSLEEQATRMSDVVGVFQLPAH
jgi:methyl-accepting chemotaxis protein-1 (serine sensor receptor)